MTTAQSIESNSRLNTEIFKQATSAEQRFKQKLLDPKWVSDGINWLANQNNFSDAHTLVAREVGNIGLILRSSNPLVEQLKQNLDDDPTAFLLDNFPKGNNSGGDFAMKKADYSLPVGAEEWLQTQDGLPFFKIIEEQKLSESTVGEFFDQVEIIRKKFNEILYLFFVFEEITILLKQAFPGFIEQIDSIFDNCYLIESLRFEALPFGHMVDGDKHRFEMRSFIGFESFSKLHGVMFFSFLHEFIHAITSYFFEWEKRHNPVTKLTLANVISEAFTVTLEYHFLKFLNRNTKPEDESDVLQIPNQIVDHRKTVKDLIKQRQYSAYRGDVAQQSSYGFGAELGEELALQGWQVDQIGDVIQVVNDVLESIDPNTITTFDSEKGKYELNPNFALLFQKLIHEFKERSPASVRRMKLIKVFTGKG
jgi:hypothetical protein